MSERRTPHPGRKTAQRGAIDATGYDGPVPGHGTDPRKALLAAGLIEVKTKRPLAAGFAESARALLLPGGPAAQPDSADRQLRKSGVT